MTPQLFLERLVLRGLTIPHARLLLALYHDGDGIPDNEDGTSPSTRDIADYLGTTRTLVSRICRVLAKRELVQVVPAKGDTRTVAVSLTRKGRKLVERTVNGWPKQ